MAIIQTTTISSQMNSHYSNDYYLAKWTANIQTNNV